MVNFRDPQVIAHDQLVATKLWHTLVGLFVWEFVTTLDYEWNIIRRRRPYRWTIWLYSTTRVATLVAALLMIINEDVMRQYNCQVTTTLLLIFMYLAFSTASLLVVVRIIAIWNRKKVIVWIAFSLWLNNTAFLLLFTTRARSVWLPAQTACVVTNIEQSRLTVFVTIVTDLVLLLIMLVGSLRLRHDGGGTSGLTGLLWRQGVIWFSIGIVTEIPPGVLMILNLNDPLNIILQPPSIIAMSIIATRMHRSLTDFICGPTDISSDSFRRHGPEFAKRERSPAGQTSLRPVEVAVHISSEGHLESQTIYLDSTVGTGGQPRDPLSKSIVDNGDLERGVGK